jgi:hypothetical protein
MQRFRPSARSYGEGTTLLTTAIAGATGASAGAAAGGAAASTGSGHIDPSGFLGLNWKAIGASVLVGTLVAIGTDLTLTLVKPRLFGDRKGKA